MQAVHTDTPFRRAMAGMVSSYVGGVIALGVPAAVLLTLHLIDLVGEGEVAVSLGIVTGSGAVAGLIVNPISGRVSDRTRWRFGRRRTWILAGGLAGASVITAITLTTEVWQVVVLWCLAEICIGFQMGATGALMVDQVPAARRGSISGALGFIVALGPVMGLAIVTPFEGAAQWVIVGALVVTGAVLAVAVLRETVPADDPGRLRVGDLMRSFWVDPRRHPAFGWAWLVRFFVGAVGAAGVYNGVYLLQQHGVSRDELDSTLLGLTTVYVLIGGVACLAAGIFSDRIRRQKPFVLLGGVLGAAGLTIQGLATTMPMVYAAIAVSAVGVGIFLSVDVALSSRMLPNPDDIGKDWGVMMLAGSIPPAIVPFFAPALLELGGFRLLYSILAAIGAIGGLLVLRLPELGREGDPRWAQLTVDE
ncbi:MFS transporter [Phycicoccus sp. CSK15P-2]|uniref:MFS transporter n=1 Tax=Phycicoccus sp. CSK15P-2 TaxID=2807627 RepID=UPI001950E181|nr:MFS transporter [Phycicoccus sp. CSK15P-2]MBM6403049.1 MFS transporter [Phycicoccus sp. CSK15P-2]